MVLRTLYQGEHNVTPSQKYRWAAPSLAREALSVLLNWSLRKDPTRMVKGLINSDILYLTGT